MSSLNRNIVLVHGLWDSPNVFNPLVSYLCNKNTCIFSPDLLHDEGRIPLTKLAINLNHSILERFGTHTPIDLFGFSMGGVISRIWLQKFGGALRTRRFISVGAPHYGTFSAQFVPSWFRSGIADMKRGSHLLRELNKDVDLLQSVKCSSYFCRWDLVVFPGWQAVLPIGPSHSLPVLTHRALISNSKSLEILGTALLSD